jgi:hypothetical protein
MLPSHSLDIAADSSTRRGILDRVYDVPLCPTSRHGRKWPMRVVGECCCRWNERAGCSPKAVPDALSPLVSPILLRVPLPAAS